MKRLAQKSAHLVVATTQAQDIRHSEPGNVLSRKFRKIRKGDLGRAKCVAEITSFVRAPVTPTRQGETPISHPKLVTFRISSDAFACEELEAFGVSVDPTRLTCRNVPDMFARKACK